MLNYIFRRVVYGFLVLVGVNILTFVLFFAVNTPDDMARMNIGGKRVTADAIEKWKTARGYDKPLLWNEQAQGAEKLTKTIFYERSLPLFVFEFGASDTGRDIGYELKNRVGPSLALALPTFALGLFVVVVFSLTLVFFRSTYLEFWGVAFAVFLLSVSGLFYITHFQSDYLHAAFASSNKRLPSNPLLVTSLTHSSATPAVAASQRFISAVGKV